MKVKCMTAVVAALLLLLVSLIGCTAKSVDSVNADQIRKDADQITENILQAMNDDDYSKYAKDFDDQMKQGLTESKFKEINPVIKAKIGTYVSKEYLNMEIKDQHTIIIYKAKFTQEPEDVIVRSVFRIVDGKIYISGFWLDSTNLRKP